MKQTRPWLFVLLCAVGVSVCSAVLLAVPWPSPKAVAALVLDVLLPGLLLYRVIFRRGSDHTIVEAALIALGLGYALSEVVTLGLHYVPGTLTRRLSLGVYDALLILLLGANLLWPYASRVRKLQRREGLTVVALLVVAALFRLVNLSYSEFQGDEVAVVHKAAAAIQGRDDVLFLHRKGPAEILLVLLPYAQGMALNEWGARLPFALANVLAVLALYQIAKRGLGERAAAWVGLLASLNGFFVAFGRIVQYQSLVLLFGALGVLMALDYAATHERRYIWLSALFLAVGMWAHSDAAFAVIPAAWLILRGELSTERLPKRTWRDLVKAVGGPVLLGMVLLAAFYGPYVTSATFAQTAGYLSLRMGAEPPYNNLGHLLEIGTVYNAVYYLAFVGAVALWVLLRRSAEATPLRWALPLALVVMLVQAAWTGDSWTFQGQDWLGLLFVAWFVAAICAPEGSGLDRPLLLWFGVPFIIFMFWFDDPRTHVYAFFPGALLLVGAQLASWQEALKGKGWLVPVASLPWLGMAVAYLVIVLVSHQPEYRRTYPDHRIRAFWVPYGDEFPEQGL
ncbi:MAG: glycosyltransferase family 39 protein, partial [Anaerolineales bacterium]